MGSSRSEVIPAEVLQLGLNLGVAELAADETLGIEDVVVGPQRKSGAIGLCIHGSQRREEDSD